MGTRTAAVCAALAILACGSLLGCEVDVEVHDGVEVYRRTKIVPIGHPLPPGGLSLFRWRTGASGISGGTRVVRQWFFFGLDRRERCEFAYTTGSGVAPP